VARQALEACGVPAAQDDLESAMAIAESQIQARWMGTQWWASDRMVRELFTSAYQAGLPSVPEVGDDSELAARLATAIYDTYHDTSHWSLYPDVLPTLEALRSAGIALGIVSDWGHGLIALVLELGLSDYLEFVVVSSRIGVAKPDPEVFRLALARIDVAPEAAAYIGDTYIKDVMGARAAGLAPVLLDRNREMAVVDCPTISSLTEVLPLLGFSEATG
jgi:putative hydrolase of the HAD superfamily